MLNEKYYGILDNPDLIYSNICFVDLKDSIKDALRLGATGFMMGDFGDLNKRAYKICKSMQKRRKNPFKIIISTNIKDKNTLERYKDDNVLFIYNEMPSSPHFTMSRINQFIVNNTFKCFSFNEDLKYLDKLTTAEFSVIIPTNCKEYHFNSKNKIVHKEFVDTTNITLLE